MTTPIVSVIIPAYNEENTITHVLERVASALAGSIAYEIIAVNSWQNSKPFPVICMRSSSEVRNAL